MGVDLLALVLADVPAESADCAENPKPRGLRNLQVVADSAESHGNLQNLQPPADSETPINKGNLQNLHNLQGGEDQLEALIDSLRADGLQVLGEDAVFIRKQLPYNQQDRAKLVDVYRSRWINAMGRTPLEHQKQNAGRFAANTWLLERDE